MYCYKNAWPEQGDAALFAHAYEVDDIADKIEQIDPALAKQAAEKLNEYSSKSKVDLSKIGAGDKDITMRKKRFYYNEDGTIISFSSIFISENKIVFFKYVIFHIFLFSHIKKRTDSIKNLSFRFF